jgi:serine/threonine protein kinase
MSALANAGKWQKNVVRFVDSVRQTDGSVSLVMEYLPGKTLAAYDFPKVDALEALKQCLEGLDYVHSRGILHRDIKPENIVVRNTVPLEVCLVDFGLANEGPGYSVRGTTVFIAPEVWDGRGYGTAVDIWALGLTALCLCRRFPEHDRDFLRGGDQANRRPFLLAVRRAWSMLDPESVKRLVSHMLDDNPNT